MAEQRQDGFLGWAGRHPRLTDFGCLAAIVVFALFLRGVYVAEYAMGPLGQTAVGADASEYDGMARRILAGAAPTAEEAIHAPLYPRFLAQLYRLADLRLPAVRQLQLGVDVAALVLVWIAARRLWRRRVACLAGLIWAGYLPLIYYSAELVSEGLVVFFLSLALFLWSFAVRASRARPLLFVAVGASLGLAAIAHPLSLLFGLAVVLLGPALCGERPSWQGHALGSACLLAGLLVPVVPVSWHNSRLAGGFVLVQDRAGMNLYIGNNPEADGTPNIPPGPAYQRLLEWPAREGVEGVGAAQAFYRRQALAFALAQPLRQLGLFARKFALTWNAQEISSGSDLPALQLHTHFMRLPFLPRFGWLAPLAALGVWLRRRDRRAHVWILLPLVYTAALTLFVTSGRYRIPMVPALVVLAALALDALVDAWHGQDVRTWRVATAIVLATALPVYLVRPPVPVHHQARSGLLLAEAGWALAWRQPEGEQRQRLLSFTEGVLEHVAGDLDGADPGDAAAAPLLAATRQLRGLCHGARGQTAEARAELAAARELRPDDPQILVHYAAALAEDGDAPAARALVERAVADPGVPALLWYELGVLREATGDPAAAGDAYARALAKDPTHTSALLNLAVLRHRAGDVGAAEPLYRQALQLDPAKARARFGLALLLAERGDFAAAVPHFRAAIAHEPRNPIFWDTFRRVAADAGQTELAQTIAEQAERALADAGTPPKEEP